MKMTRETLYAIGMICAVAALYIIADVLKHGITLWMN